jgi:hypothetical protein
MASPFFLTLFQHTPQFNPGYCFGCRGVVTESHRMAHLVLNKAMVGFNDIIEVFALANFDSSIVLSVCSRLWQIYLHRSCQY